MAFDDNVMIRLTVDATNFRTGVQAAGAEVEKLNVRAKETAGQFNAAGTAVDPLTEKLTKLQDTRIALFDAGDVEKAKALDDEIAKLEGDIKNVQQAAQQKIDMGIDVSRARADIQELVLERDKAAAQGNWGGVTEANKGIGFLQAQVNTVNTVGLKEGQQEWAAYAKAAGIATEEARGGMNNVVGGMENAKGGMGSLIDMGKKLAIGLGLAFGATEVVNFAKESMSAFMEAEKSALKLKFAVETISGEKGLFSEMLAKAKQLQGTSIFPHEQIEAAQTMALQYGMSTEQVSKLIPKIVDLASATGGDLPSAMEKVIRGTEGQMRGLKVLGVAFKDTGDKTENLNLIMDKLSKFSGAAGVSLETASGRIQHMKNEFDETKEAVGSLLLTAFSPLIKATGDLVKGMMSLSETKVSDRLEEERMGLNKLVLQLQDTNISEEERNTLIKKIKQEYPDFLKGLNDEKISNEELAKRLSVVNDAYVLKIRLAKSQETLAKLGEKEAEYVNKVADARAKEAEILASSMALLYQANPAAAKMVEDATTIEEKIKLVQQHFGGAGGTGEEFLIAAEKAKKASKGLKEAKEEYTKESIKIAEDAVNASLNVSNSLDSVSDEILQTAKKTKDATLQTIVNAEILDRSRAVKSPERQLGATTGAKEAKDAKEAASAMEELSKKIEEAQKAYDNYVATLKGKPLDAKALGLLDAVKVLETQQEELQKMPDFIKKYGVAWYNQFKAVSDQIDKLPNAKKLKLQLNFDWSSPDSMEAMAEQLKLRIDEADKKFGGVWNIPVELNPQYQEWTDTLISIQTLEGSFNSEIKKAGSDVVDGVDLTYTQLYIRRQLYLDQLEAQNKAIANALIPSTVRAPITPDSPYVAPEPGIAPTMQEPLTMAPRLQAQISMPMVTWTKENDTALKAGGDAMAIAMAENIKKAKLPTDKEIKDNKPVSIWESWFGVDDPEIQSQLSKITEQSVQLLTTLVDQYVQAQKDIVDSLNNRVSEQEKVVEIEFQLNKQGSANNLDIERTKLAKLKQERDRAQKDQEKAVRAQMALQSLLQISSIITSAANLFESNSKMGVVGVVLAIASIGAMLAMMATMKSKASAATMREGGSEMLVSGKRHEQGGVPITGTNIEAEQGESVHVVRREQAAKYFNLMSGIVQAANNGTLVYRKYIADPEKVNQYVSTYVKETTNNISVTNDVRETFMQSVAEKTTNNLIEKINSGGVTIPEIRSVANRMMMYEAISSSMKDHITNIRKMVSDPAPAFQKGAFQDGVALSPTPATMTQYGAAVAQWWPTNVPQVKVPIMDVPKPSEGVTQHTVTLNEIKEIKEMRDLLRQSLENSITVGNGQTIIKTGNVTRTITHES